ncbi:MAG: AIR synthase family protein [Theionarchaea archaeon]|nr:AIR synthase family protein [Theionarchaea archaeon]
MEAEKLKALVLPYLGASNEKVLVPPRLGEDAAVIDLGFSKLVAASDPITGAIDHIGMYAVNINANDVACTGAPPEYFLSVLLLSRDMSDNQVEKIAADISYEAKKLSISIIGGHTESLAITNPIVVGTMLGLTERVVTTSGATLGDDIILTKGAAIEGTSILATDFFDHLHQKIDTATLNRAQKFLDDISIVKEAMIARAYATAMHDPTEGGIAGALHELADASHTGFWVEPEKIPIMEETQKICAVLNIDPLKLISSGSLLITVNSSQSRILLDQLRGSGIIAEKIGKITEDRNLDPVKQDELWRLIEEFK